MGGDSADIEVNEANLNGTRVGCGNLYIAVENLRHYYLY